MRLWLSSPILLLLALVMNAEMASSNFLNKCCPPDQALDVWSRCADVASDAGHASLAIRKHFIERLCKDGNEQRWQSAFAHWCSKIDLKHRNDNDIAKNNMDKKRYGDKECKGYEEYELLSLNTDLTLTVRDSKPISIYEENLCVDAALAPDGNLEGIVAQIKQCNNDDDGKEMSVVSKCCPLGQSLSSDLTRCVDTEDKAEWLQGRFVRDSSAKLATGKFELAIATLDKCEDLEVQQPIILLKDGRALLHQPSSNKVPEEATETDNNNKTKGNSKDKNESRNDGKSNENNIMAEDYFCVDRYLLNDRQNLRLSSVVSLHCRNNATNTAGKENQEESDYEEQFISCSSSRPCIPKCCGPSELFDTNLGSCVHMPGHRFEPKLHSEWYPHHEVVESKEIEVSSGTMKSLGSIVCPGQLMQLPQERIKLLANGNLYYEGLGAWSTEFCVDTFSNSSTVFFSAMKCVSSLDAFSATHSSCSDSSMLTLMHYVRLMYSVCGLISVFCLLLTLYVYGCLPKLKNLHGKIVRGNVVAVLITTVLLIVLYNVEPEVDDEDTAWTLNSQRLVLPWLCCSLLGYSLYYFGCSMFFWMSVMCFDLCSTFVQARLPRRRRKYKFLLYSIFAWSMPSLMLIFVLALDQDVLQIDLRPDVGKQSCFLSISSARVLFYWPILALLSFNTIMFLATVKALYTSRRQANNAGLQRVSRAITIEGHGASVRTFSNESNNYTERRAELVLFFKLFLIMGLSWFLECIHVELHGDHSQHTQCNFYIEVLLRMLNAVNMLRGVLIFVVFVAKASMWRAFLLHHPGMKAMFSCARVKRQDSDKFECRKTCTDQLVENVDNSNNDANNVTISHF